MAYQFVDTVPPTTPAAESMPAEAMRFNGEYIENMMDVRYCTYRTLYVRGRESLLSELNTFETGAKPGSGLLSKRFPAREIVVGYKLQAVNNAYFRLAYNQLNSILNTTDAELLFYDEQDKYFIGTPQGLDEIEAGRNFVQGEIIILCADPFKYSLNEYEVEPTEDNGSTFVIDYNGTYPARPTLEAYFNADCGFVAWFDQDANIIQIGDDGETEGEYYTKSETLISQDFRTASSVSSALSDWEQNVKYYWLDDGTATGSRYEGYAGSFAKSSYLYPSSFGNNYSGAFSGCCISQRLPTDSNGDRGATNWRTTWTQIFQAGSKSNHSSYRGGMEAIVIDSGNGLVAAVGFYEHLSSTGSVTGTIRIHTRNQSKTYNGIDFAYGNSRFGSGGYCTMTKSGSTVSFNLGGLSYSLTDSGISSVVAYRVIFTFLNVGSFKNMTTGLYDVSFVKNNVTDWRDVANKFGNRDTATAECSTGEIYLNGAETADYGVLGNNWEAFTLTEGYNQIAFTYSDWCTNPPTSKLRYREVFL